MAPLNGVVIHRDRDGVDPSGDSGEDLTSMGDLEHLWSLLVEIDCVSARRIEGCKGGTAYGCVSLRLFIGA